MKPGTNQTKPKNGEQNCCKQKLQKSDVTIGKQFFQKLKKLPRLKDIVVE